MWKHVLDTLAIAWLTAVLIWLLVMGVAGTCLAVDYLYTNHFYPFMGGLIGFAITATSLSLNRLRVKQ